MKAALKENVKEALKARDKVRLETVRGILAAIQYEELQKGVEDLPADAVTAVLKAELKKRKEQLEFAEQGKRPDLVERSRAEILVVEGFLPKQMAREELEKIVTAMKQDNPALDMGAAMKLLKEQYSGQYDGKLASEVVKGALLK